MKDKPIEGQRYRLMSGAGAPFRFVGRIGVASGVEKFGAGWRFTLSNLAEWGSMEACSWEVEPVADQPAPTPEPKDPEAWDGLEAQLVADITAAAKSEGWTVKVIGQKKAKGSGTSVGFPDMAFRRPEWPCAVWVMIETKTADGRLTPEQEEIRKANGSYIARSVSTAMSCLAEAKRDLDEDDPAKHEAKMRRHFGSEEDQ